MRTLPTVLAPLAFLSLLGCASAPSSPSRSPSDGQGRAEAAPTEAGAATDAEGGTSPDEAAPARSFAELAKAALACPFEEKRFDEECDGHRAFFENGPPFEEGKANSELVKMIGSKDLKVRVLGASRLGETLPWGDHDTKLADAILDAAARERDEDVISSMAFLTASLDLAKVGRVDEALQIAKTHPVAAFGDVFAFHVGSHTKDEALARWARDMAQSGSREERDRASLLLHDLAGDFPSVTCPALEKLSSDANDVVRWRAMLDLAKVQACSAHHAKVVASTATVDLTKRIDANVGPTLGALCKNRNLAPGLRARAGKAARRLAEAPALEPNTQRWALEAAKDCGA